MLCVGLGQEGVLWISDTETILAFSSSSSIMAALQCFAVVMTWHIEMVQLHIWPPMTAQVKDYMAATSSHPSGALAPVQGEKVETQPSPSKPLPNDEPQPDLTQDIRELCLDQVWEELGPLHMEIARREGPPLDGLQVPWGGSTAEVDDTDVKCLLSMLTAGLRMGTPRINTCSGHFWED